MTSASNSLMRRKMSRVGLRYVLRFIAFYSPILWTDFAVSFLRCAHFASAHGTAASGCCAVISSILRILSR
ncbi:hypothetical protein K438DRAFT_1887100 [Mycena galopus ATCC 62051]|nr:hypothetical protein K438DRAFT_1887100 [Mycena galopus ATCC 62051]